MRIPSRFMPKYLPERSSIWGWLLLLPFIVLVVYAFSQYLWIVGVYTVVVIASTIVHNRNFKARLTSLAALRQNESICTFAKSFDTGEVDTWVIRAVYEQLQIYLTSEYPQFPIRADDRLNGCLITDPDDLDFDLATEISQRTGRSLKDIENNPFYGKVETVRDLVMFFNAQPIAHEA
jgi:hypothetical protein